MNLSMEELKVKLYDESLNYYVYSDFFCGLTCNIRENGSEKKSYVITAFFVLDPVHVYEYALSVEEGDKSLKESCLYECVQLKNPNKVSYKINIGKYKSKDSFPDENSLENTLHELKDKDIKFYKTSDMNEILSLWEIQIPQLLALLKIEIDLPDIKELFINHLQKEINLSDQSEVSETILQGKEKGRLFEDLEENLDTQIKNSKAKKKI